MDERVRQRRQRLAASSAAPGDPDSPSWDCLLPGERVTEAVFKGLRRVFGLMGRSTFLFLVLVSFGGTAGVQGQEATVFCEHKQSINCIAFSPDGKFLAAGGGGNVVKLWEVATRKEAYSFPARELLGGGALAFSPDGKTLAVCSEEIVGLDRSGIVRLWDTASKEERLTLRIPAPTPVLAFSPDGKTLAATGGYKTKEVILWDPVSGKERARLQGHSRQVTRFAFAPDGKVLAAGTYDGQITFWDVAGAKALATVKAYEEEVRALAFSPDGKKLASGEYARLLSVWKVPSGKVADFWDTEDQRVDSIQYAPDGKTLAVAGGLQLQLYDAATGQLRAVMKGPRARVTYLAFSPDGKTIASCWTDRTVRLWNVPGGK